MSTIRNKYEKLRRNELCPCDDNMSAEKPKKYKNCCLLKIVRQEQKVTEMISDNKEIEGMKRHVASAIQHDIDHPIILPDNNLCVPGNGGSDIIIP